LDRAHSVNKGIAQAAESAIQRIANADTAPIEVLPPEEKGETQLLDKENLPSAPAGLGCGRLL
jgi:hypothetical protein